MRLTLNGLFHARWSKHVREEWIRAVLRDRPDIPIERLHTVRDAMNEHAEDKVMGFKILKALIERCELRAGAGSWQIAISGPMPLQTLFILTVLWLAR